MEDRRVGEPDTGQRRRETDPISEFALLRDKVLLGIGGLILIAIAVSAIFVKIRNPEVALAALTVAGGLLGAPTLLRLDEAVRRRSK